MALSRILFCLSLHRFCWLIEGERPLRIQRRSRGLFVSDLPAVSLPQMASPPATSREGSLTTAVFRFSGTVPDEPPSGCRRTVFRHQIQKLHEIRSEFCRWILLNGYTVHLRQNFSGDLFHGTVEWPRSDASRSEQFVEISGGFTGISFQCILPYLSFGMNSLVGAPVWDSISPSFSREKCLLPSFLLSMKGDVFSVSLSRYSSSFFTVLSSCVAVYIRLHRESLIDAVKLGLDFAVIIFF
ncbi:hypothetical protein F2Q69_00051792 [Brassica cretica]|uniref:Uncharacterized protein n=1 Tax=Brassica cretica TaxID=69181 RepID=A0A8S9PQB4_BRACR|nr:hypothetical protein F2Q69_00051792 [Brassica cretica]